MLEPSLEHSTGNIILSSHALIVLYLNRLLFQGLSSAIPLHVVHLFEVLPEIKVGDIYYHLLLGWKVRCNTINTNERLRMDRRAFLSVEMHGAEMMVEKREVKMS